MKQLIFLLITMSVVIQSCKKYPIPPDPEFILSYVTNGDTVSLKETISFHDQPKLSYNFGHPCYSILNDNNVFLDYRSTMGETKQSNANFFIRQKAPVELFDSFNTESSCKAYFYKEQSDFFPQDFREGELSLLDSSINDRQLMFKLLVNNKGYSLQSLTDPFNSFKITKTIVRQNCHDCVDWHSLYNKYFFTSDQVSLAIPTIEFQCKLKSDSNPNDTLTITNGVYQCLFVQERK